MSDFHLTLFLALGANLLFSSASLIFTTYSRKVSPLWMNTTKATVAFVCFGLTVLFMGEFHSLSSTSLIMLLLSGFLGLAIGDHFLFSAFRIMGPGRTLIFFGIHPLVLGLFAMFLFDQSLNMNKLWGILFFLLCLFIFSLESKKTKGSWELKGLLFALAGVLIDASGILLTRYAFNHSQQISSFEANFYRAAGALIAFSLIHKFITPIKLFSTFKSLQTKQRFLIVLGCVMGTFMSLSLYLRAVQTGHLATVSGIAITAPLFATFLECLLSKKWPSKYLWAALVSFVIGFTIVL